RELLRRRWWTARLQCNEASAPEPRFPSMLQRTTDGVTIFVHAIDGPGLPDSELVDIAMELARAGRGPAIAEVAARLGDATGLVRLSADADQWQIPWPFEGPLWLVSPRRAPVWWDVGRASMPGRPGQWLAAHADDLVVAMNRPLPSSAREHEE